MNKLIFIDTNILLDFYRFRTSDANMKIDQHHNILISTSQVEMEYKKHRAEELKASSKALALPDWNSLKPPPILSDSEPFQIIEKHIEKIKKQIEVLKGRLDNVFNDPVRHDKVFQTAQRLFKNQQTGLNLNRDNIERFRIRKLALKRWILGYPPRKKEDNSIGDAINWEWIVDCGIRRNADVIIVSRDNDYGQHLSKNSYINEWLLTEYKDRVNKRKKVVLTNRLSFAFKEAVSKNVWFLRKWRMQKTRC